MKVAVVVPFRGEDPHRVAAYDWVHAWYRYHFPAWAWHRADCAGPWSKPRAVNETVAEVDADVLVISDADVFVDAFRIAAAVRRRPWCVPHTRLHRLTALASARLYGGERLHDDTIMKPYGSVAGGGLFTIPRAGWDQVGGFDEAFVGWGCEDQAFAIAADTLLGSRERIAGPLWHLYHDPGMRKRDPTFRANLARLRAYRRAAGDPDAIRALR